MRTCIYIINVVFIYPEKQTMRVHSHTSGRQRERERDGDRGRDRCGCEKTQAETCGDIDKLVRQGLCVCVCVCVCVHALTHSFTVHPPSRQYTCTDVECVRPGVCSTPTGTRLCCICIHTYIHTIDMHLCLHHPSLLTHR